MPLETIRTVDRNAILDVIPSGDVGIFLRVLITQPQSDVRRQLIADSAGRAHALKTLIDKAARIGRIFIEELRRKQSITDDVPGNGVTDVIERDIIRIDPQLAFVARAKRLTEKGVDTMRNQDVRIIIREIMLIGDQSVVIKIDGLIPTRAPHQIARASCRE